MRRSGQTSAAASVLLLALSATAVAVVACSGPASDLPPEKQALESFAAAQQSSGPAADKSADPGGPLIVQTDPPPLVGLLGQVTAPISGSVFTPTNAWAGWVDQSTYVQVYAGDSPAAGGLMFVLRRKGSGGQLDPNASPATRFVPPPESGGPLVIVRVESDRLIVANQQGDEFRFDPASGAFDAPAS